MKSLLCLILGVSISPVFAISNYTCSMVSTKDLADGVQYKYLNCQDKARKNIFVHELIAPAAMVTMQNIGLSKSSDKNLKTLPDIAKSSKDKTKIIAGVNGGFFNMVTLGYIDDICGNKTEKNYGEGSSYLYINKSDWSYNCVARPVMAYAPGIVPMLVPDVTPTGQHSTLKGFGDFITSAGGGGPTLVVDNTISIDEDTGDYPWINTRAARTAIGTYGSTDNGKIYIVTVEAIRGDSATGMTIPELADFMKNTLSVENAMNLDGGGSSTMCITDSSNGKCVIKNKVTGGIPREIHDGLFILKK